MSAQKTSIENDAAEQFILLKLLEGRWKVTASHVPGLKDPEELVSGTMIARTKNMFLEAVTEFPQSAFPLATTIIGLDDTNKKFVQLYTDDRGVCRVYRMTLTKTEWELQRQAPGFHQRFKGSFENNAQRINAFWERSKDGVNWFLDFNLQYMKEV